MAPSVQVAALEDKKRRQIEEAKREAASAESGSPGFSDVKRPHLNSSQVRGLLFWKGHGNILREIQVEYEQKLARCMV